MDEAQLTEWEQLAYSCVQTVRHAILELVAEVRRLQRVGDAISAEHRGQSRRLQDAEAEVVRLQRVLYPYVTRVQLFDRAEKAEAQRDAWRQMAEQQDHCFAEILRVGTSNFYAYQMNAEYHAIVELARRALAEFDRLVAEQEGTGASGPGRADRSAD